MSQKDTLESYRQAHNALVEAAEKENPGDHKAWLYRIIEVTRKDIMLAAAMIDEKKPDFEINRAFNRIDLVFNKIK